MQQVKPQRSHQCVSLPRSDASTLFCSVDYGHVCPCAAQVCPTSGNELLTRTPNLIANRQTCILPSHCTGAACA
eukprot:7719847-Alexandrium_andersonii.AAC.1